MAEVNCFDINSTTIRDGVSIHVIDIKSISEDLKKVIDKYIVTIWQGKRSEKLPLIKKRVFKFLETKVDKNGDNWLQTAAIAEFFLHLFLNLENYKQECLFKNLEERSFKKGFDGYYSNGAETWIMESKASSSSNHPTLFNKSYNGIKNKICGKDNANNPWENAYNHANLKDVDASDDILKELQQLSADFDNDIYYNIKDFNVIPCSTIFYTDDWKDERNLIIETLTEKLKNIEYKNIKVICINKMAINLFMNYLQAE